MWARERTKERKTGKERVKVKGWGQRGEQERERDEREKREGQ